MITIDNNEPSWEEHNNSKQKRLKKRKRNLMHKSTAGSKNPVAKDLRTPKYQLRVKKDNTKYVRMAKQKIRASLDAILEE